MKKGAFGKIKYGLLTMVALAGILNLSLGHLAMASGQHSMDEPVAKDGRGVCVVSNSNDLPASSMLPCCLGSDHKMIDNIDINQKDDTQMSVVCESYGEVNFSHPEKQKNTFEINFSPPKQKALIATVMRE